MRTLSILYISHVSWGWIKQRPQFIAEELSKNNQVDVFYRKILNRSLRYMNKNNKSVENLHLYSYVNFPFYRFIKFLPVSWLEKINQFLWDLNNIDYSKYDYIYLCDVTTYSRLRGKIDNSKIIYDCMDDKQSFPQIQKYPKYKEYCFKLEKELLYNAGIVICSADYLKNTLISRFNIKRKYEIVNNAISSNLFKYNINDIELPPNSFTYIGTVAEWFDFNLIKRTLEKYEDIYIVIYGPSGDTSILYQHPRLLYKGTISHDKILAAMKASTGLIMPFVVNDLIKSVNPVKLYEYIYAGKPIAAVKYGESEKFKDYVHLYSNDDEFFDFIEKAKKNKGLYPITIQDEMKLFAQNNTWENRADQITNIIKEHKNYE